MYSISLGMFRPQPQHSIGQISAADSGHHYRRLAQLGADLIGGRSGNHRYFAGPGQRHNLLDRPGTGVFGQHDTPEIVALQSLPHPFDSGDDVAGAESQPQQPGQAFDGASSLLSSSVSSERNAISWSVAAGVIPGSRAMSSRSRSSTSFNIV